MDALIGRLLGWMLVMLIVLVILGIPVFLGWLVISNSTPTPTAFEQLQATIEECVASELYTREQCMDFMTKGK